MTPRLKRLLILAATLLVPVVVFSLPTPPDVWDAAYEALPAAGDPVGEGDDQMRSNRVEVRKRAEVEHHWATITANTHDNGLHRVGSARCFLQTAAPTAIEAADYDDTGATAGVTTLSVAPSNDASG